MKEEMNIEINTQDEVRILSRVVAVELSEEEIEQVSGGAAYTESGGDCDRPLCAC